MGEPASPPAQVTVQSRVDDLLCPDRPRDGRLVGADPIDHVVMMEDHDGAYYAWEQAGVTGRVLLHVDAHIDWAWIADRDPRDLLRAPSLTAVESMLEERGLWNLTQQTKAQRVHIGNYIYPALKEGIVREFYWIVPDRFMESPAQRRKLVRQFDSLKRLNPRAVMSVTFTDHRVVATIEEVTVTACTLSHLHEIDEPVLLDIDTDFLMPDSDESARAGHDLWKQLPWTWPDDLVERLKRRGIRTDFVTIAYSVEGGFTPLGYKYLGDELALRLKHPQLSERQRDVLTRKRTAARHRHANNIDDAIAEYEAAVALAPEDASSHFNLAHLYDETRAHDRAAVHYREAVQLDPTYATSYNTFGPTYHALAMHEEARQEYRRLLRWDPHNVDAQYGLADLLARQEQWEAASRLYRTVIDARPDHAHACGGLGYVLARRGLWEAALSPLSRAVALQPSAGFAHFWLGEAYAHQQRWDEALEAYRAALRCGFRTVAVHRKLADLYLRKHKVHKALEHCRRLLRVMGIARALLHAGAFLSLLRKALAAKAAVLTADTRLGKNDKMRWRVIEGEAILLDLDEGEVLRLNPVAAEIWNAIDGTRTAGEIVAHICRTFEVSQRTARRDVHRFLEQLLRYELVEHRRGVPVGSA
jgi:tetratricopeptide (TPR) repeat protein